VGANVQLTTSQLFVGNATVNSTHTSALVQVSNSTATANLTARDLTLGSTVVNSAQITSTLFVGNLSGSYANLTGQVNAASLLLSTNVATIGTTGYFVSNGNVGIGQASPAFKLDITGAALGTTVGSQSFNQRIATSSVGNADYFEITETRQQAGSTWVGAGTRLQQKIDSTWMGYIQFNGGDTTLNSGGLSFGTGTTTTSAVTIAERMRIDATGNVGIGNTTPGSKLTVGGDTYTSGNSIVVGTVNAASHTVGTAFTANSTVVNAVAYYSGTLLVANSTVSNATHLVGATWAAPAILGATTANGASLTYANVSGQVNAASLLLSTNTATIGTGSYFVANGNVGVGTSTPTNKLDVFGDGARSVARASTTAGEVLIEAQVSNYWSVPNYTGTSLRQSGSTATGTYAGLTNANLGSLIFQNGSAGLIATNGGSPIVLATTATERMRIEASGNVGIGNTAPASKLVVSGNVDFRTANILLDGVVSGGFYKGNNSNTINQAALGNIFRVNSNTLTASVTFAAGENGTATGPVSVATGITLTISTGARVSIV